MKNAHDVCACGAPQPRKMMVFKEETKTNFTHDKRYHRFPSRIIIEKGDIAYVTTQGTGNNKDFVSVYMTDGTEYFSDHRLSDFLQIIPDSVQPNKSFVVPVDKISASNEWMYIYVRRGEKEIPFEITPSYKEAVVVAVTAMTTLPRIHEKRLT
ncbi:MAG: hypothetical protein NXI10_03610 [bacterium]|nr:hypothetical protein [bacterium]